MALGRPPQTCPAWHRGSQTCSDARGKMECFDDCRNYPRTVPPLEPHPLRYRSEGVPLRFEFLADESRACRPGLAILDLADHSPVDHQPGSCLAYQPSGQATLWCGRYMARLDFQARRSGLGFLACPSELRFLFRSAELRLLACHSKPRFLACRSELRFLACRSEPRFLACRSELRF